MSIDLKDFDTIMKLEKEIAEAEILLRQEKELKRLLELKQKKLQQLGSHLSCFTRGSTQKWFQGAPEEVKKLCHKYRQF